MNQPSARAASKLQKRWLGLALCMQAATSFGGCTSADAPPPKPAVASVQAVEEPFTTLWTRPEPAAATLHPDRQRLELTRIGVNTRSLALDFNFQGRRERAKLRSAAASVTILADGCPVEAPKTAGSLTDSDAESRLIFQRDSLPKGDLDLTVEGFGSSYTVLFANDAQGLRPIVESERKNVRYVAADPAHGVEAAVEVREPNCPSR